MPAVLGDSYLEIILSDTAVNYPIGDSIRVSVEGTYSGKKISHVETCDTVYLHKILHLSKVHKRIKETIVEFIVTGLVNDSDDEDKEPQPQKTSPGPVHRESTKPTKKLSAAGRTPVASCTYILTSGLRKGKQESNVGWRHQTRQVSFVTITKDKHDAKKTDQNNLQAPVHSPDPRKKDWPGTMTNLVPPYFLDTDTLCINHTPISPATKTKPMYVQQQIQRPCLKK